MTHTGEEWFAFGWQQYLAIFVLLLIYLLLSFRNKLPSMSSFKDFLDSINSAGGHIFILGIFTAWSIKISMQFFYHLLSMPAETVSKSEALTTAGITFVTGSLTGQFMGAMLKTMSGGKANGVAPPSSPLPAADSPAPLPGAAAPGEPLPDAPLPTGATPVSIGAPQSSKSGG